MILLAAIIFIAIFCSILLGAVGYVIADRMDRVERLQAHSVSIWRLARISALLPFVVAIALPVLPQAPDDIREMTVMRSMREPVQEAQGWISAERPRPLFEAAIGTGQPRFEDSLNEQVGQSVVDDPVVPSTLAISTAWLAGLVMVIYSAGLIFAMSVFALNRMAVGQLVSASFMPGQSLRQRLDQWAHILGLKPENIDLKVSDRTTSPFLTGVRPLVIVPSSFSDTSVDGVHEYALVHELVHARRGDELDRLIGDILGILLWFNPAFGRIESRLSLAREIACDAETLKALGEKADRRAYARALIDEPWVQLPTSTMISAFGFSVGKVRKMRIKAILKETGHKGGQAFMAGAAALMFAGAAVPVATAQAMVSTSLTANEISSVVESLSAQTDTQIRDVAIAADPDDVNWGSTPIQRSINASPLAGLLALEQLEVLEVLENLNEESILRPGNWAAIGAFMSGMSSTLSLTLEDDNGNPVRIVAEPEGEGAAEIEFTDETGRRVLLDADADRDGSQIVTIGYVDDEEPYFSVVANDEGADLRFFDPEGRPTLMGVREYGDDAIMRMEDVLTGMRGEFIFSNDDDTDEVFAPADGEIVTLGEDDEAGRFAVIDHGNGWSTIFFNMADIAVSEGQRVAQGDLLGLSTDEEFNWDGDADSIGIDIMRETNLSIIRTEKLEF